MVMPLGMYGMYGMNSYGGNVYESLKQRYGCGHSDFGTAPKLVDVPVEIVARRNEKPLEPGFWAKYGYLRCM